MKVPQIIFTFLLFSIVGYTQEYNFFSVLDNNRKPIVINRKGSGNISGRPNMPEINHNVECWYENNELCLTFTESEGQCYLYVEHDTGGTFDYYFDSSDGLSTFFIGSPGLFQQAEITITTELGNEYYGCLFFE